MAVGLGSGPLAGQPLPAASSGDLRRLERRCNELDRQIRALEELLPAESEPLKGGAPANPSLPPHNTTPLPPLALPEGGNLREDQPQALSLEQTLAIGFANSPSLQARREEVAAGLAELQSQMGTYWPRISAYAAGGTDQESTSFFSPTGSGTLFAPSNPFFIPPGGRASLNTNANALATGLQLRYELLDFARTPKARAALASLLSSRLAHADALRRLQLTLSESYYQLQRADQLVRIRQAVVGNDLLILQESLDLKQAGLVPRLDVLRRQAIKADDQEQLIAALADQGRCSPAQGPVPAMPTAGMWGVADGGCCGATVATSQNTDGSDWSVGLAVSWLLFDAGTTRGQERALARRGAAVAQQYAAQRNDIRLRIEQAFFGHEASLARLVAARRGVAASLEAFRDARRRYQAGLSSELDLSNTQVRLICSLVQRLEATVNVNVTYAQLLPMPTDPGAPVPARLQLEP
ncbi:MULTISPECIES: TolC family protein [unclassified Cyanobium]|uniref:TolC family protein n=1 Tax=unclassified Cyanobium TaxID=2627006 RepID=UPI0020CDF2B1|nr:MULTISPECIES: TolC family protein [unclassified Cyanobium]